MPQATHDTPLSWYDAAEDDELNFGDDANGPIGEGDEELLWEGEKIDGYPARERSMEEIRERRKEAIKRANLDRIAVKELVHVERYAPEPIRLYAARVRAARRLGIDAVEMHGLCYAGKVPEEIEAIGEFGFAREARWAKTASVARMKVSNGPVGDHERRRVDDLSEGDEIYDDGRDAYRRIVEIDPDDGYMAMRFSDGSHDLIRRGTEVPVRSMHPGEPVDARDSTWTEGKLRGRQGARVLEAAYHEAADRFATGFAPGDHVQEPDGSDRGTVDTIDETAGTVKVRQDGGGAVTYDQDSVKDLKRANVAGRPDQHHAPKGTRSPGKKGDRETGGADVQPIEPDFDEKARRMMEATAALVRADREGGIVLQPHVAATAYVVRWPNLAALPAALPKLAGAGWLSGIDVDVVRAGGSWDPDAAALDLEARFANRAAAERFAKTLVDSRDVDPRAIEGRVEDDGDGDASRYLKAGALRVDTVRRVLFPGGVVFALEGNPITSSFQVGDNVLVADELSNQLVEAKVAAVGPDVAVVRTWDGSQYEYAPGELRRLHLARLVLDIAPSGVLAVDQRVVVGRREGVLKGMDERNARVRMDDGPRVFPRERVTAIVRLAHLP